MAKTIDSNFKSAESCYFSTKIVLVEHFPNHVVLQRSKSEFYISLTTLYDSLSDVGEIRVYQRADFQSGSRVLKKVF